jgi:hypothetical protein
MGLCPKNHKLQLQPTPQFQRKFSRVNNMQKTITITAKAVAILFVLERILPFNLTSATISLPLKKSHSEKVEHFAIFDKIGQLAAGLTYIHVQLYICFTCILYISYFVTLCILHYSLLHLIDTSCLQMHFSDRVPRDLAVFYNLVYILYLCIFSLWVNYPILKLLN